MLFTKKSLVIVAVLSFYILIGCKETKAPEKQLTTLSQPTDKNSIPILLTFSFQPSLQKIPKSLLILRRSTSSSETSIRMFLNHSHLQESMAKQVMNLLINA